MSKNCGNWSWLSPDGKIQPWYCGRPNCAKNRDICHSLFKWHRTTLIDDLVVENGLWRFFTLTVDPALVPPGENPWSWISYPWSKLRKRLNRIADGNVCFRYVAVLEKHKKNERPHIHGFTNMWIHIQDWTRNWQEAGGGRICWIEKVEESKRASGYVTKYIGKDQVGSGYLEARAAGSRTFWRSRGLKSKKECLTNEEGWVIVKEKVYMDDGTPTPLKERIRYAEQRK